MTTSPTPQPRREEGAHEHEWRLRQNVTSSGYKLPPYRACACGAAEQVAPAPDQGVPEDGLAKVAEQWKVFRQHRPVGAYLPVGQLDGDCRECGGSWPCSPVRAVLDAVQAEVEASAGFWTDKATGKPCPTRGERLCTATDPDHRHIATHMLGAALVRMTAERDNWRRTFEANIEVAARADRAEQQVAAVRALAEEWERIGHGSMQAGRSWYADALRAVLDTGQGRAEQDETGT